MIPKRLKRPKMGLRESSVVRCQGHLKWVRGHACCVSGKRCVGLLGTMTWTHECKGRIEAHHVSTRGSGGGDEQVVPLCSDAHGAVHGMGRETFRAVFNIDLEKIAAELWRISPHGVRYRQQQTQDQAP